MHQLSALDQSAAIRRGEFTSVELTTHYLERTDQLNETVGAFITVMADDALRQAATVDERITAGDPTLGRLAGCVAPVKDLDLVEGVLCTFGSKAYSDFIAPEDAAFVTRMKTHGLVITGKTNTPEFGLPCYTENQVSFPARTPWDLTRSAGGSSGGAATAVASGLASVAQGSDGGGSIRIPASVTGLVGIKPSRGRVGQSPMIDGVGELAVVGPLGRTVADAAALLDVLVGASLGDPFWCPTEPDGHFLAAAQRAPAVLKIGRFAQPITADVVVEPACLAAYDEVTQILLDLGHQVEEINRPYGPEVVGSFERVWAAGAAAISLPPGTENDIFALTRYLRERGNAVTAVELMNAVTTMRTVSREAIEATSEFDVVLTPTLAQVPALVGELHNEQDPAADFEAQKRFTPFTAPFNVSGQPAMSLPLHHTSAGLPIGVQLVGRPRDEATLVSVAAQIESVVGWTDRVHSLW